MAENLPCWHVPVPMAPRLAVERFAKENFATVVRLPFKSQDALTTAQDQIESLRSLETPLHLFLERVRRISIDAGAGSLVRLDRTVRQSVAFAPQGTPEESTIVITRLELGTEPYVVAHRDIADDTFKAALKTSLAKGEVPESWRNWEGRARVSIAVPLRQPLGSGRLYCFLPLGPEGRAPFAGYINANFYTKMDRRAVDTSNHLNDLFLRTAVSIGGCLIEFLATSDWSEAPSAVVSLLCWDGAYLRALQVAMGANGQAILNRPIMPVRGAGGTVRWASPKETYAWTSASDACLSVQRICEVAGGHLLVELLTEGQLDALNRTYAQLRNYGFAPPPVILAGWVEKIATKMQEERAPPERWAEFYDEVAEALSDRPDALFGRRFLLSVNGELISSDPPEAGSAGRGRRSADVYFAPVLSMDASVEDEVSRRSLPLEELPDTLRKGFALLSRDIPWGDDDVGHRPGRTFLRTGRLVREYDTGAVLRTLAGVTRSASVDRTREQALEWAFRLWNSSRSLSDKETRSANFCVPSTDGWIEAEAAMFGYGWDVRNAKRLHTLLGLVADLSEELKAARGRILPDFADWPVRHGTHSDWLRFLAAAGVTDCLRPVGGEPVTPEPRGNPAALVALIANAVPKMAEPVRAHWLELLTAACRGMYATCPYKAELKPWHFPGQWEAATFPDELRRDYAVQIVYALRAVGEEHRGFRAMRSDYGARVVEQRRLPTPLVAHLTGADWMPVMRPGRASFCQSMRGLVI